MPTRTRFKTLATLVAALLLLLSGVVTPFVAWAQTTTSVYGIVTQAASDGMTLQTPKGSATVSFDSSTTFKIDGNASASASDLKAGMHAAASGPAGQPAVSVLAYTPKPPATAPSTTAALSSVYGVVTQVGSDNMTLQTPKGAATVTFDSTTTFKIDGNASASASDLKVGMHAAANGPTGKPAAAVLAYTPKPPAGTN